MDIQDSLRQAQLRHAELLEYAQRHNQAIHRSQIPVKPNLFQRIWAALKPTPRPQPRTAQSTEPIIISRVRHPAH